MAVKRVKIKDIVESQLPRFVLEDSPKVAEFLRQYYISQEFQGGSVDLAENLDQYIKLDHLVASVINPAITLEFPISASDDQILLSSVEGLPDSYGLVKIDDEIITYTGVDGNTLTGCVRGFSGIVKYRDENNPEELIFESTNAASHTSGLVTFDTTTYSPGDYYYQDATITTMYGIIRVRPSTGTVKTVRYKVKNIQSSFYQLSGPDIDDTQLNQTVVVNQGDIVQFEVEASGHPLYIQSTGDGYDTNAVLTVGVQNAGASVVTSVQNLSVEFLKEFFIKLKTLYAPGFEDRKLYEGVNIKNFLANVRSFYQTKGTRESFRILFSVLYGKSVQVVDLEDFVLKSSTSNYLRRATVVAQVISGDPLLLTGQTLYQDDDPTNPEVIAASGPISEVEIFSRQGEVFYKIPLFIGYNEQSLVTGRFYVPGYTKNTLEASANARVINVDSTVGFSKSGKLIIDGLNGTTIVTYTDKNLTQFLGCSGLTTNLPVGYALRSNVTAYGFEEGDSSRRVDLRITGVLGEFESIGDNYYLDVGNEIYIKSIGEDIGVPADPTQEPTYKQKIFNSWLYNVATRYQVKEVSGSTFTLFDNITKNYLKTGDQVHVLPRDSSTILTTAEVTVLNSNTIQLSNTTGVVANGKYDIRRIIERASSTNNLIEFGNETITSDIQNTYVTKDKTFESMYVACQGLPSFDINVDRVRVEFNGLDIASGAIQQLVSFVNNLPFVSGDEVIYEALNGAPSIGGLESGKRYFIWINPSANNQLKLTEARSFIDANKFITLTPAAGTHRLTLAAHYDKLIQPQKILRQFPLFPNVKSGLAQTTTYGATGMLINGVEIINYKSSDFIAYGPLESLSLISGGTDYDIINPPNVNISNTGAGGTEARVDPVITGSLKSIYLPNKDVYDIDQIFGLNIEGGNGQGASASVTLSKNFTTVEFNAKSIFSNGGVDVAANTITFTSSHNFSTGQKIVYNANGNNPLGIAKTLGSDDDYSYGDTLENGIIYFPRIVNTSTIQLHLTETDAVNGINTVGITTLNNLGIHKFRSFDFKNKIQTISVVTAGEGYTRRTYNIKSNIGINTSIDAFYVPNHGYKDDEVVVYQGTDPIRELTSNSQYRIIKLSADEFRLANSSIDVLRNRYINFSNTGSGIHTVKYPDITAKIVASVGGTTISIDTEPDFRGEIISTYLSETGSNYGSNVLNFEKSPTVTVISGRGAQFQPFVSNGVITGVQIIGAGEEYTSAPDLVVNGEGTGAQLKAKITNKKVTSVEVISGGLGYNPKTTTISVTSIGRGAIIEASIRKLTVNLRNKYSSDDFLNPNTNYPLQYGTLSYSQQFQDAFGDSLATRSPIIGWAYDGNPIFGPFGTRNPKENTGITTYIRSGYELRQNEVENRPSTSLFPAGFFVEDYKFVGNGDLDEYNGRFFISDDFPQGIYGYCATLEINPGTGLPRPAFPYYIGNSYISPKASQVISQDTDLNTLDLNRNTYPYKLKSPTASYDFIIESDELVGQEGVVDSIITSSVEKLNIIESGDLYKVNDKIVFDEEGTNGQGINAVVSFVKGKDVNSIQSTNVQFNDVTFIKTSDTQITGIIEPNHQFNNNEVIEIFDLNTDVKGLSGFHVVGVATERAIILDPMQGGGPVGLVTDVIVSRIPTNVSGGSSIRMSNGEVCKILNVIKRGNILRLERSGIATFQEADTITYLQDKFIIESDAPQFESEYFPKEYFNPKTAVGVGTTVGNYNSLEYYENRVQKTRVINHQEIFVDKHPFFDGQKALFVKPAGSLSVAIATAIGVGTTAILVNDSIPRSGTSQEVWIVNKSINSIGIKTERNGAPVFFTSNGSDFSDYYIQGIGTAVRGSVKQPTTTVTTSEAHGLQVGDKVSFNILANNTVGIGTSTTVRVELNSAGLLVVDSQGISSAGINTVTNRITVPGNNFRTGDRIFYEPRCPEVIGGLGTGRYFVYKDTPDEFRLCETYEDVFADVPVVVSLTSIGGTDHNFALINPKLEVASRSSLNFDLQSYSLNGYGFKIYYDRGYKSIFVGTGKSTTAEVGDPLDVEGRPSGIGATYTKVKVDNNTFCPPVLYYNLTKNGFPIDPDKDVKEFGTIKYVNSAYTGEFEITSIGSSLAGVGTTAFSFAIARTPEKVSYAATEARAFYSTASLGVEGPIDKVQLVSGGEFYSRLPRFVKVESERGNNATIKPESKKIGKINSISLINEGFNYSSDQSLRPIVDIPNVADITSFNTIDNIEITANGRNYISAPKLALVDRFSGIAVPNANIFAEISRDSGSVTKVGIDRPPTGLKNREYKVYPTNNTNGIVIVSTQSNPTRTGIVTFTIATPVLGFTAQPFKVGDMVWIEGFETDADADGYNSTDHKYNYFKIDNIVTQNPFVFEVDYSNYTLNVGLGVSDTGSFPRVIKKSDLADFNVTLKQSTFEKNEKLVVNSVLTDLQVISFDKVAGNIKYIGLYQLQVGDNIAGSKSGSRATVQDIISFSGVYSVKGESEKTLEGVGGSGKLNSSFQVLEDNNYYQNLSYTLKSEVAYDDCIDAVNNTVHPTGLKNFVDNQIVSSIPRVGIQTATTTSLTTVDLVENVRVDDVYNYDLARDLDVKIRNNQSISNKIELQNAKLSDYIESKTNRVLPVDDISSQFSNLSNPNTLDLFENIYRYPFNYTSNRFLVQITTEDYKKVQVSEITILQDGSNTYYTEPTFKKLHNTPQEIGTLEADLDEENSNVRVRFYPTDPYNTNYNIKIINNFYDTVPTITGIGTTQFGFAALMGADAQIGTMTSKSFVSVAATNYNYLHAYVEAETLSVGQKETLFAEVVAIHDTSDSYIGEYNIISSDGSYGGTNAGTFGTFGSTYDPINNKFSIDFYNNSTKDIVQLKSRIIGFGKTEGTTNRDYRFLASGMIPGNERSARYYTEYQTVGVGSTANFAGITSANQSVNQCTMIVGYGRTFSCYQYLFLNDYFSGSLYFSEYPVLSVGNTSGLGTVYADYDARGRGVLIFTPDPSITEKMYMRTFNEVMYLELEQNNVNPLQYGVAIEEVFNTKYTALNLRNIFEFPMDWNGYPIYTKTFNPAIPGQFNPATGVFNIKNHFFTTGQPLVYTPGGSFVGLATTAISMNSGSFMPGIVYAIKDNEDNFRVGLTTADALAGIGTTFADVGSGNVHKFDTRGKLERSLIAIDGIVQKPLTWAPITRTLEHNIVSAGGTLGLGKTDIYASISGISSIVLGDLFQIEDELVIVDSVGVGVSLFAIDPSGIGTYNLIKIQRGAVGTAASFHANGTLMQKYTGSYNIVDSKIFFTGAPNGGKSSDEAINTGIPEKGSSFSGRVFLRKDYSTNKIFDDISGQFTGIARTFTLKSEGQDITGIGSEGGFGIFFVNNMFQKPQTLNNVNANLFIRESGGQSNLTFTGTLNETGDVVTSFVDINQNGVPRGGIVVTLGSSEGQGFAELGNPSIGASVNHAGEIWKVLTSPTTQNMVEITDFIYDHTTGLSTVTTSTPHGFIDGTYIDMVGIGFTCNPTKSGITTGVFPYTRGQKKNIANIIYDNTTGMATVTTVEPFGILNVGEEVFFNGIGFTCIGQKYAQISQTAGLTTTIFPTRTGIAKTISDFKYHNSTGIGTITLSTPHRYQAGDRIYLEDLELSCGYGIGITDVLYNASTGLTTVTTASAHGFSKGDKVRLSGIAFTCPGYGTTIAISDFEYDNSTGISTITLSAEHGVKPGQQIKLVGLGFTCDSAYIGVTTTIFPDGTQGDVFPVIKVLSATKILTNVGVSTIVHHYDAGGHMQVGITSTIFPSGNNGFEFIITSVPTTKKFRVNVGTSTIPHTYVSGGTAILGLTTTTFPHPTGIAHSLSDFVYDNTTGIATITVARGGHTYSLGDRINFAGIGFTCDGGSGLTTSVFPSPLGRPYNITGFTYDNSTGLATVTTSVAHDFKVTDSLNFEGINFSCPGGSGITTTVFPDTVNFPTRSYRVLAIQDSTKIQVDVGVSTIIHTYVAGGTVSAIKKTGPYEVNRIIGISTFCCNVGISTYKHYYTPANGVGEVTKLNFGGVDDTYVVTGIVSAKSFTIDAGISTYTHTYAGGGISRKKLRTQSFIVDTVVNDRTFRTNVGPSTYRHVYDPQPIKVPGTILISNFQYNNQTGLATITAPFHGIRKGGELIRISGLALSCPGGSGITTTIFPSADGLSRNVTNAIYDNTVGILTVTTAVGHGITFVGQFVKLEDLGFDCAGGNTSVTGATYFSDLPITGFDYTETTGVATVTAVGHGLTTGENVRLSGIAFTCPGGSGITTTIFPDGTQGFFFGVNDVIDPDTFVTNVGISTIAHTYVSGGIVRTGVTTDKFPSPQGAFIKIFDFEYNNQTGLATVTTNGYHQFGSGQVIKFHDIHFTCPGGSGITTTVFPDNNQTTFVVKERINRHQFTVNVGISTIPHTYDKGGRVSPVRYTGPYEVISINSNTEYEVNVGRSAIAHTYTSGGTSKPQHYTGPYELLSVVDSNTLKVRIGISTYVHTYVSGGKVTRLRSGIVEKKLNPGPFTVDSVIDSTKFTVDVGICTFPHFYHSGGKVGELLSFFPGSGYYGNTVPVTLVSKNGIGSGAAINATVGYGGSLVFTLNNVGSGYTDSPIIRLPGPSYDDVPVKGLFRLGIGETTQTGFGLSVTLNVGGISTSGITSNLSGVKNFSITNPGYGFAVGDKLTTVGLVTAAQILSGKTVGYRTDTVPFELQVLETYSDTFYAWQFGQIDYIDDVTELQNGESKRFPLRQNGQLLSFEKADGSAISFPALLLIFVNGVLQLPNTNYIFEGGTSFEFTSAPQPDDQIAIYFYRGSNDDVINKEVFETIKVGDEVIILRKAFDPDTVDQDPRVVNTILASDTVATNLYTLQGINDTTYRPLVWRKQKNDRIVDGRVISKSRETLEPQIYPTARVIGSIGSTSTSIFVDSVGIFNWEELTPTTDFDIVLTQYNNPVVGVLSVGIATTGANAGSISTITVLEGGSGYSGIVTISISNPSNIRVGFGTTALATAIIGAGGSIIGANILNAGSGYSTTRNAYALAPYPQIKVSEEILAVTVTNGYDGALIGIDTGVGIGTNLALKFTLDLPDSPENTLRDGFRIWINGTNVGSGVTSIDNGPNEIIGIGTNKLDNIYKVHFVQYDGGSGVVTVTCNVKDDTNISGLATVGTAFTSVGRYSWGILTGFTRSQDPISISADGFTPTSGLSTYPLVQRRGYGLRNTGAIRREPI